MRRVAGLVVIVLLVSAACSSDESVTTTPTTTTTTNPLPPASADDHLVVAASGDGALQVEAPDGSLPSVDITVDEIAAEDAPPAEISDSEVLAAYELGPDGAEFDEPLRVVLEIPALTASMPTFATLHDSNGSVEVVPTRLEPTDQGGWRAVVEVDHFSSFVVRSLPEWEFTYDGPSRRGEHTIQVGETVEVRVTIGLVGDVRGNPDEYWDSVGLSALYDFHLDLSHSVPARVDEPVVLTATCNEQAQGTANLSVTIRSSRYGSVGTAGPRIRCVAPEVTTTTTLPPPEAFDLEFPVFDIELTDDGELVLVGFSDVAFYDPAVPRDDDNPHRVPLPGPPEGCVTEDAAADGEPATVSPGDSCDPELLTFDDQKGCYWVLMPTELNCYDENGTPIIQTSEACPPSEPGLFDGRNEKSAGSFGAICDPQAPVYLGATATVGGTEVEVPFVRKSNGELGYVLETGDGGHEYITCFEFTDHNFDDDDISYVDGVITVDGHELADHDRVVTRHYSWPGCELLESESPETRPAEPQQRTVELDGETLAITAIESQAMTLVDSSGAETTVAFPEPVMIDQFSPIVGEEGVLYLYAAGVTDCCDEQGNPFDEPQPDFAAGDLYSFDPATGELEVIADEVGRMTTLVVREGVLWATQFLPNRLVPFPLS